MERRGAGIPDLSAFADGPDEAVCEEALTFVREADAKVLPTADVVVDDPVRDWLALAR